MLIEADASGLEVVGAAFCSQDPVLMEEVRQGVDIHKNNMERFKFLAEVEKKKPDLVPDKQYEVARVLAKIFKFRLIYGGSAWSYALDPEFNYINDTPKYWQKIIDEYYRKYTRLAEWHREIVLTVQQTGRLVMPTGRIYTFEPYLKKDQYVWPRTQILNYPVQGLGHDLMAIARVVAFKRITDTKALFVNSVHDSIVLDVANDPKLCYNICSTLEEVFKDIPKNFQRQFGVTFNLPMKAEVKYGMNWGEMTKFNREKEIVI